MVESIGPNEGVCGGALVVIVVGAVVFVGACCVGAGGHAVVVVTMAAAVGGTATQNGAWLFGTLQKMQTSDGRSAQKFRLISDRSLER